MYNTIQKTIAAWAFNHYIAYYYFDNINVSQLKVAFEKGEVELENLPIKRDALHHFKFPMDVVSGVVGKLSIKVPLLTILTDPWVIKISDLLLTVAPKKHQASSVDGDSIISTKDDDKTTNNIGDQTHFDILNETTAAGDASLADYLENTQLEDETSTNNGVNSEETKLAEFYSSFSSTVSSMVRDIYKNIRLEIESMTIVFEDSEHGLVKFNVGKLFLHRPKTARNLTLQDVSIYLSSIGVPCWGEQDDLIRLDIERCSLDIFDEACNNMQLVVVQKPNDSTGSSTSTINSSSASHATTMPPPNSETKVEGHLNGVSIDQLTRSEKRPSEKLPNPHFAHASYTGRAKDDRLMARRQILSSDAIRVEFKLNNNLNEKSINLAEEDLHLKLDLIGMQYIHSQRIYEITTHRLLNLLKFTKKFLSKRPLKSPQLSPKRDSGEGVKDTFEKHGETSFNKLLIVNIEEGLLFVVDDTTGSCGIPLLEFSLEDCRILQFSGRNQQNGFIFAKIGCNYYNREVSTWEPLLRPWPFNLSWDLKSLSNSSKRIKGAQHKEISLTSDEIADFVLSSALLDLGDVALKRIIDDFIHPKLWPLSTSLSPNGHMLSQDFNSIFVLHNDTGHRLQFAPLEHDGDLFEVQDQSKSSSPVSNGGDVVVHSIMHKLSVNSRSSAGSRDSPDLKRLAKWTTVEVGETVSFEFESLPIYRRHISDQTARSRVLLVRVEGWKTLTPIPLDKTGLMFREAFSDRVMNEDIFIAVSINLEESSARKIISIRSPLNLVNLLDATLEVHFVESNQALYIKPNSHLAVPLPYLFNRMHIRPCNVGVTMSERALLWDKIKTVPDYESRIHICHPITVTSLKHASYCTSQPYRVCVSIQRDSSAIDTTILDDISSYDRIPVYSMSFIPPLTIVNLLPCKLQYFIGDVKGSLAMGSQQKVYHVDTTKPTDVHFQMNGFPSSKAINIDPGATGSFNHTLEMFDQNNRSLYLNAKIILSSLGEEPAVQVIIYARYWFLNKTRLPLIFKQEGAALEAAGQFREHEESSNQILLFSFYDTELEPPWLCSMRLGKAKGLSMWCEGFKLDKGSGERRIHFMPKNSPGDSKMNKSLIDIQIRRGFGQFSETLIVTFTARYGFDPLTKTPRKATDSSPQNYKLTSYNHNANLAERIAGQAVSLFSNHQPRGTSALNVKVPGFKLTLVDNSSEKLIEASIDNIIVKCTTKAKEQIIDCSVQDLRIVNALPDCEKDVMLDRAMDPEDEAQSTKPAIRLIMDRILGNSMGTTLFRQVQLSMCELVLNIEEKLALKLVEFISFRGRGKRKNMENLSRDLERILHPEDDRKSKYYFDLLRIDLSSLKLSVFTSANLSNSLQKLKVYSGLKFFGFEEAKVQLAPYFKMNVSRTFSGVFESVTRFYKRQILEQAPRIVGQQIQNYLRFHLSDLLSSLYDEVYNKLFN